MSVDSVEKNIKIHLLFSHENNSKCSHDTNLSFYKEQKVSLDFHASPDLLSSNDTRHPQISIKTK